MRYKDAVFKMKPGRRRGSVKKEHIGMLEMVLCAVLWSIAGIFMKLLPWHGFAVAGIRSLIAGCTFLVYMAVKKIPFTIDRRILLAGVLAGCTYICFATANKLTTAANAIVLQFTSPIFILIYSALLFHQKTRKGDLITVFVVLAGIALFFFDQLTPSGILGNLVAILAGMFMAGMYVAVGTLDQNARFSAITIGQFFAFLVGLPVVLLTKPVFSTTAVFAILVLGVFQLGISYILYVKATETCPALACCLLGAVEPLLNPLWVLIFDGERPGVYALCGGLLVITAVTAWCIWDGKTSGKEISPSSEEATT